MPWEDNSIYKTVNGYHEEALKKFSDLTKKEREDAAKTKIACLSHEDKMPCDTELDKVINFNWVSKISNLISCLDTYSRNYCPI